MVLLPIPADADIAAAIARIFLGALFLSHGIPKIRSIKGPIAFVTGTGFPGGAAFAVLFTLLEFFGAIALIIGFLTQIVAVLFVLEMIATTIFARTKLNKKFSGGYELDILFLALSLTVAILGPGLWSLDRALNLA